MRIIEPSFKILNYDKHSLLMLEHYGRTCYKSEKQITGHSSKAFVSSILNRGHESVIEHVSVTVRIICDRGVSHEIVRHRLASYSQESTRYCNYSKEKFGGHITYIKPCFFPNIPIGTHTYKPQPENLTGAEILWFYGMLEIESRYFQMVNDENCQAQEARSILPNSLKTEIIMTANVREWRHFFKLRTAKAAHPQMREIAIPMLDEFKTIIPVIFDDIHHD